MASYNRVILMGNLTRDPELRQAQSGTHVMKVGLAVNDRVPDGQNGWREETSFVDLVMFGRRAEAFARYMSKGRPVLVEGKLRQSRWQDRETGQNRTKLEVIVDDFTFVGGRGEGGGQGAPQAQPTAGTSAEFPGREDFGGGQSAIGDDDVPF